MFDYVKLLLKKYPVLLHIDDNDPVNNPWRTVLDIICQMILNVLSLIHFIVLSPSDTRV